MSKISNPGPLLCAAVLSFVVFALASGLPAPAHAELKTPTGEVVLIVAGNIAETNVGEEAHFDRDMLMALGMESLTTETPFEDGVHKFEGPLVSTLLTHLGASGRQIVATALDGYAVEIPLQDMLDYPVLLAMIWNGEPMGVRSKGPVWIVYPIDQFPELKAEKYSTRSVWQLSRIEIR